MKCYIKLFVMKILFQITPSIIALSSLNTTTGIHSWYSRIYEDSGIFIKAASGVGHYGNVTMVKKIEY